MITQEKKANKDALLAAKNQKYHDALFTSASLLILASFTCIFVFLIIDMFVTGLPRLSWTFLESFPSRSAEKSGILSAWVGSFLILLVTAISAIPVGLATGIYLEEYTKKNWLSRLIETNITNLAGVPSIIYALFALGIFVYYFNLNASILTAGLTLGLLILPMIIVTTRESLRAVPISIREAAYAAGASRWQLIIDHLLPYSISGIITGIILSLSRAIGETAPVITIGALTFVSFLPEAPFIEDAGLFDWMFSPFTTMPLQIFNWTSRPSPDFHANAAAASIVLISITLSLHALAIYLRYKLRKI